MPETQAPDDIVARYAAALDAKVAEYATLSDAKLVKKIRHLDRTIARGIRTGFLQRNIELLEGFRDIALAEARKRLALRANANA